MPQILKWLVFYNWTKWLCSQEVDSTAGWERRQFSWWSRHALQIDFRKQRDKRGTRGDYFHHFTGKVSFASCGPLNGTSFIDQRRCFAYHLYSSGPPALQTCSSRAGPSPTSVLECVGAEQEISRGAAAQRALISPQPGHVGQWVQGTVQTPATCLRPQ